MNHVHSALPLMKTLPLVLLALILLPSSGLAAELPPPPSTVLHVEHAKMEEAFGKGMSLAQNSSYKISTSRRTGPGIVEVHDRDTDIFYVLDGSATFVTGGNVVEPKPSGPAEVRGREITGGESRQLAKGDMMVVPSGVPHWFKQVNGTFVYLVIKITR
jgi:mannose-6-phosphate isomerase-like protein (cupin superfamily)